MEYASLEPLHASPKSDKAGRPELRGRGRPKPKRFNSDYNKTSRETEEDATNWTRAREKDRGRLVK